MPSSTRAQSACDSSSSGSRSTARFSCCGSFGLPRWADFANMSPCYELWGISGVTILFHALFVGIPLLSALAVAVLISRRGLKILRDVQVPYQGEKVFRLTRIKRGR